jgi:hypothetical protein
MDVIPPVRATRFEQLDAGDLFLILDAGTPSYAIKTARPSNGDRSSMVLLGPTFVQDVKESFIAPWRSTTVLSFGKNFSILLSANPTAWSSSGPGREPVCLAIAENDTFVCTNGGMSPEHYLPCFVEVKTGVIVERRPSGSIAFTTTWEIALLSANGPPFSVLKYPLQ